MFLHLSLSHSVHRGEYLGRYTPRNRYTPLYQVHTPPDQVHHLRPGTPPGTTYTPRPANQVHPPGRSTPPRTRYTPRTRFTPPRKRYAPWDWIQPLVQVHPRGPATPPGPGTAPLQTRYTTPTTLTTPGTRYPPDQVHHSRPGTPPKQCMLGDTGNKWVVRILPECILVILINSLKYIGLNIPDFSKNHIVCLAFDSW